MTAADDIGCGLLSEAQADALLAEQRSRHTRARLTGVKEHSSRDGTVFWDATKPIQYKFDGNFSERLSVVDSDSDICLFFGPSSINDFHCKINISLDRPLKNCAHYRTLGGGIFRSRIYGNPADYANRPNCSGSKKTIS